MTAKTQTNSERIQEWALKCVSCIRHIKVRNVTRRATCRRTRINVYRCMYNTQLAERLIKFATERRIHCITIFPPSISYSRPTLVVSCVSSLTSYTLLLNFSRLSLFLCYEIQKSIPLLHIHTHIYIQYTHF